MTSWADAALAEAVTQATRQWRADGVPERPGAWLLTVGRRRGRDRLRRDAAWARKAPLLVEPDPSDDTPASATPVPDERLRLLFTCCHPALATEARIALTLRTVAGLTVGEIARAFLVSEGAMAQRLTRAKGRIRDAGIPYRVPVAADLPERVDDVLHVLELIFNEGYAATHGEVLVRRELTAEAVRLARLLHAAMPEEPEVEGLLALFLLQSSRLDTRTDADGRLLRLEDQDRSRWDGAAIAEGTGLVERALRRRRVGPYQLRAAIAATDWAEIAALYAMLARIDPSPVVRLNGAVALSYLRSPSQALAVVDGLAEALDGYHPFHVVRGELLDRCDRPSQAAAAFERAAALAGNAIECAHLRGRREDAARRAAS